jgi:hypothetical protein
MTPMDVGFLKDRYDAELARCNRLTDSLGLPVAALTAFGSLISVMGAGFSYKGGPLKMFFMAALAADCCAFGACLMFLGIAYYRQDVAYLQTLGQLRDAAETLRAADPATAADRFAAYLESSMIEATDMNAASNDRRAAYLYRARAALMGVVLFTGLAALPYVVDQVREPRKVPVVHIDNLAPAGGTNAK